MKPEQNLESQGSVEGSPRIEAHQPAEMKKPSIVIKIITIVFAVLVVMALIGLASYIVLSRQNEFEPVVRVSDQQEEDNIIALTDIKYDPASDVQSNFATYEAIPVNTEPKVEAYTVASDLSNIANLDQFYLNDSAKELLAKNGFVVQPSYNDEFFPLYENNRYGYTPNFITTDSILHNYHLMFADLLKKLEEQEFIPELKKLNKSMLASAVDQYEAMKGTEWENAALRNLGFFSVAGKLLDNSIEVPKIVTDLVDQELNLINKHEAIEESFIMNVGREEGEKVVSPQGVFDLGKLREDYSQYIPRGHYDRTEELKAYFKTMMWYGRLSFRFKEKDEVRSSLLITLMLMKEDNQASWNNIYEPTVFFVGKSDDITFYQLFEVASDIYGHTIALQTVRDNKELFDQFFNATAIIEPPQLNSMPIFQADIELNREDEIKAFRFMGQRFTIDASVFQRLLYREVGDKTGTVCVEFDPKETNCLEARCLPKGLDIASAMGSAEAADILDFQGENEYTCYQENMAGMQKYISELKTNIWTQNLYWGWVNSLRPLLDEKGEGYPSFMQTTAWLRKSLNTFLGSWAELKHDTILYAKQVYAEMGAGGFDAEFDDRGYVEPNPEVYARLAGLLAMTRQGLDTRGLLNKENKDNLQLMEDLVLKLKIISEKELNGQSLSEDDYELIRSYGGQLEHFWIEVNKDEDEYDELGATAFLSQNPVALIADVATDPNGRVLEVGIGNIFDIFVVVPIDGQLRLTKGGVYSYYEFTWPMNDRLTDKKWWEMKDDYDNPPALPEWTSEFIAE